MHSLQFAKIATQAEGEGGRYEMWAGQFNSRGAYTIFPLHTEAENAKIQVFAAGGNVVLSARCKEKQ